MSNNIKDGTPETDNDSPHELSPEQLSIIEIPANHHKLQYPYWLWFRKSRPGLRNTTVRGYEQALQLVGRFATVEQWWAMYSYLVRPEDLPPDTSFNLFKLGIRPMWEDEANINGGKWVIRLRKGLASRTWEDLCMAMLGEQFLVGSEICGIVISIKFQEDILSIWHKTSSDQVASTRIRDTLRRILHLAPGTLLEYKTHTECLKQGTKTTASNASAEENSTNSTS